jgi:hypothetical protein
MEDCVISTSTGFKGCHGVLDAGTRVETQRENAPKDRDPAIHEDPCKKTTRAGYSFSVILPIIVP